MNTNKLNIFIKKASKIHCNKYNYSLVEYVRADKLVKIKCEKHGIFEQSPNSHLSGCGCKQCFNDKRSLNFDDFVKKCLIIHNNKYNYSKSKFKTTKDKIIIICNMHGEFTQRVSSHLSGNGCRKCQLKNASHTKEIFIKKADKIHNYKYNYDNINYKNQSTKIKIKCSIHDFFMQLPSCHLSGRGCPKCKSDKIKNLKRMPLSTFILRANKIHKNKYDYSFVNYLNNFTKININCPKHGIFKQKPIHHLNGSECPLCSHKNISKLECEWLDFLKIPKENRNYVIKIEDKKYIVDGFDNTTNTAYEFYGDFWHGNIKLSKYSPDKINKVTNETFEDLYIKTINREKDLTSAGYKVISIWENDWIKSKKGK